MFETITIVLIILKAFNVIDISWFMAFLPEIIGIALYLVIILAALLTRR